MKIFKVAIATTALIMATGTAATAAQGGNDYGEQPGYSKAMSNTVCAGHGAFGVFGPDYNMAGGANGELTGLANSALCGHR